MLQPACRLRSIKPGSRSACRGVQRQSKMRIAEVTNEIQLRGPNVILGYLNQPEKTAETIDAEGWLHTGDVGRVDDDGYFYITDRMKDIIITAGGKNVTPSEWENELKFSPYVTDAVDHRRQAALPDRADHDRPGERREVRAGSRRAVLQLQPA
jgi:acyl-CoA synthetase (AMP-forming)/AMP-acid ligase II